MKKLSVKLVKIFIFQKELHQTFIRLILLVLWSVHFFNSVINLFHAFGLFLYLLKTSENLWFLVFSEGIERDQWHEIEKWVPEGLRHWKLNFCIQHSFTFFKVKNGSTRTMCEICSKLTTKIPERRHWPRFDVFFVYF